MAIYPSSVGYEHKWFSNVLVIKGYYIDMSQVVSSDNEIYFQKQGRLSNLCGMHLVNNYLGFSKYNEKKMNQICYSLSSDIINPHKSIFGGNYDVNVLIKVFQAEGIELLYHDARKPIEISNDECGFIINYETDGCSAMKMLGFGRHWELIKKEKQGYMQFDSLLEAPFYLNKKQLLSRMAELNDRQCTILKMLPIPSPSNIVPQPQK